MSDDEGFHAETFWTENISIMLGLRLRGSFLLLVPLFLLEEFIDELDDGKLVAPHRCLLLM
jgi:hypothetical protein